MPGKLSHDARIGIIGAGRLGTSLALALTDAELHVTAVSSRRVQHRDWLQNRLPNTEVVENGSKVASKSDVVFVTTSDDAIRTVADSTDWTGASAVIHCSGASSLDLLGAASKQTGLAVGGFHPLQTFPTHESWTAFKGITFGVEARESSLESWLKETASRLGGRTVTITSAQRPAYHAAAVMACGLLTELTGLAAEVWASTGGIDRQEAVKSLAPLVRATAESVVSNGIPGAITGPYVRGDIETVKSHLGATTGASVETGAAYAALALAGLHIAREQGGLTDATASSIRQLLRSRLRENCDKIENA